MKSLAFLILGVCLAVPALAADPSRSSLAPPAALERLPEMIGKELAKHKVKGLAIAVADAGGIVWADGFGMADEARGLPMRPDTVMNLGSGAKLFTALGALALAGQGRLDLDAPATGLLPSLPLASFAAHAPAVTPRRMMTHHAGLPANHFKGLYTRARDPQPLAPEALADMRMAFTPGASFSFSNLGTSILGMLVEKAAGEPFAPWMDKTVFKPMGLADTAYTSRPAWKDRLAVSYGASGPLVTPGSNQIPAVSLYSTAMDQARFVSAVLGAKDRVLPQGVDARAFAGMLAPHNAGSVLDMDLRVGLGWNLNRPAFGPPGTVAWNFGRTAGFRSLVMVHHGAGVGVVVLANSSSSEEPRDSMIDRVADEALRAAMASKGAAPAPAGQSRAGGMPPVEAVPGSYATILGVVKVSQGKGRPVLRLDGKNLDLEPGAEGVYAVKFQMFGLTLYDVTRHQGGLRFSFAQVGGATLLVLHQGGERELFGVRVEPFPASESWQARLGKWTLENQGDDLPMVRELTLRAEDGLMLYETRLPTLMNFKLSIPLQALSESEARLAGPGGFSQAMGDVLRFEEGADGERLHYAGYVFRKM